MRYKHYKPPPSKKRNKIGGNLGQSRVRYKGGRSRPAPVSSPPSSSQCFISQIATTTSGRTPDHALNDIFRCGNLHKKCPKSEHIWKGKCQIFVHPKTQGGPRASPGALGDLSRLKGNPCFHKTIRVNCPDKNDRPGDDGTLRSV